MSLILRNIKGSPLTYTELDNNFQYLESISITGTSTANTFTTGVTLVGDTLVFDRNDQLSAYTVDLSTLAPTGSTTNIYNADGTLTGNRTVDLSNNNLIFNSTGTTNSITTNFSGTNEQSFFQFNLAGLNFQAIDLVSEIESEIEQQPGSIVLKTRDIDTNESSRISVGNVGDIIIDSNLPTFEGAKYSADYSANFTNRSLVDKEYVDGLLPSGNTFTTGATLVGNVIVFDRNDALSAYTVDLSTLAPSGGTDYVDDVVLSGNSLVFTGVGNAFDGVVDLSTLAPTGGTDYVDDVVLSGNNLVFTGIGNAFDGPVDLSSIISNELWLSGATGSVFTLDPSTATTNSVTGNYSIAAGYIHNVNNADYAAAFGYGQDFNTDANYAFAAGRQNNMRAEFSNSLGFNNTNHSFYSLVVGQGNNLQTTSNYGYVFGQNHVLENSANYSVIMGGAGSLIKSASEYSGIYSSRDSVMEAENSVILGGVGITADTNNTVYVPFLNIRNVGSGTSINNLGIDADGNVVVGSGTGTTGNFLPISGGTLTGDLEIEGSLIICNSGATASSYTDCSSNEIKTGVTNSAIAAGSGNTINANLNNVFVAGVNLTATTSDTAYFSNLNVNGDAVGLPYSLAFAASDETTAIVTGTSVTTLYAPIDFDVTKVKVSLSTSGSSTTTIDVKKNGTTILSSPISLSSGVFVNSTTSISAGTFNEDDRITVDITAAGTDAAGVKVYLIGKNR
jgi:hypothetical protein